MVFGGQLPGGEQWQSGFWVQGAVPADAGTANELAGLWKAQLSASDDSGAMRLQMTLNPSSVTMDYVRVYPYPTGGPVAPFVGEASATLVGTGFPTLPNQACVVLTLLTNLSGRRHRGRMYLPAQKLSLAGANGQAAQGDIDTIVDGWTTCFSDWNESGDNGHITVVSATGSIASTVTSLRARSRLDVQRRRANKQSVFYTKSEALTH